MTKLVHGAQSAQEVTDRAWLSRREREHRARLLSLALCTLAFKLFLDAKGVR